MRIGFPCDSNGKGGVRTWIKTFSNYCVNNGHEVFYSHDSQVDVFITLANLSNKAQLEKLKSRGSKIVIRMDGIFFDYFTPSKKVAESLNNALVENICCSDLVIFQSKFSKDLVDTILGNKKIKSTIIYNGIDKEIFSPNGDVVPREKNDKKIILSMAYWGTPEMADFSIRTIVDLARKLENENYEFWILGEAYPETEEIIKNANLPNITKWDIRNPISHNMVPKYLRTADLVLHVRPNDACSNFILEALNINKPIVGLNSGSTPELVGDCALLANCYNDIKQLPVVDIDDFALKVIKTFDNYDFYKKKIIERSKYFTQELMSEKYIEEIKRCLEVN